MKPILEIQHVSKRFVLNSAQQPYLSLRDSLTGFFKPSAKKEDFWALNDVSLDIYEGDTVGIIGKNGAGKSTLLKILSRITPPTSGKIVSRGRIASLLEVGTGFHPELTGRENVYMNGSILGMRRKEIDRNFDAIIDFAGIERFVDTPLKHYSSGMQLRLAFAVAAFLENEILIIDEVLAVGDAEFQKKCMTKMGDISQSGRTILFVSHNMAAIESLCKKGALLNKGCLIDFGPTSAITKRYLDLSLEESAENGVITYPDSPKSIKKIELCSNGVLSSTTSMGAALEIKVYFEHAEFIDHPVLGVIIRDSQGAPIYGVNNNHFVGNIAVSPVREGVVSLLIPSLHLFEGIYFIDVFLGDNITDIDSKPSCLSITVESAAFTPSGKHPDPQLNKVFDPEMKWKLASWER